MAIKRYIELLIEKQLFKGKIIIITGARRVGKTFVSKKIAKTHKGAYFNCDLNETQELLETTSKVALTKLLDGQKIVILDEAQTIPDIGLKLKIMNDSFPETQIIATGSSSFDLIHKTAEPMTGRSRQLDMYPLSISELKAEFGLAQAHGEIDNLLRFGAYPEVYCHSDEDEKIEELMNISDNYLYRDMLTLGDLKKPELILNILRHLAFQVGSEVSLNELSRATSSSVNTISNYLEMLEKSFVIFPLGGFSRNLRKELVKAKKYYFYDLGIRNALIRNFNPLKFRNDVGALWENFCIIERMKRDAQQRNFKNRYFWRTYDQQEINYVEEYAGKLEGYELKYKSEKFKKPAIFLSTYQNSSVELVNKKNYLDFVL